MEICFCATSDVRVRLRTYAVVNIKRGRVQMTPYSSFWRDGFDVARVVAVVFRPSPGPPGGGVRRRGKPRAEHPEPLGCGRSENSGGKRRGVLRGIASDQEGAWTVYKAGKNRQGVRGGGLFARVPRRVHVNRRGAPRGGGGGRVLEIRNGTKTLCVAFIVFC